MSKIYMMEEDKVATAAIIKKEWHIRHDDEIWTDDNEYVATAGNEMLAEVIVNLHNGQLGLVE